MVRISWKSPINKIDGYAKLAAISQWIDEEESISRCRWSQMVNLARTTLRNIIGTLTLRSANSERGKINSELQRTMREETSSWGIEIVRAELKEIDPPPDVQETMNRVVKAENEKVAPDAKGKVVTPREPLPAIEGLTASS